MATTIQIKRSTGTSAPGSLAAGELAVTFGSGTQSNLGDRLFVGDGSTVEVIGGKFFSDMLDHTQGTLTASSALTVDNNSALSDLNIGNHATTGGSIQLKEGTNNGSHHVQLKSPNSLGANLALTLPSADGSNTNVLRTNGSGTLSFGAVATSELSGTITNAQLAGSIADSKLNQITTAGKVALSALEIDGGTDIGADLSDADLIIVDDGANGTEVKSTLTRVKKYIFSALSGDATASDSGALTIANGSVENAMLAGSIANGKLANSTISIDADSGTTNAVDLGDTLQVTGGEGIDTSVSGDTLTIAGEDASTSNKGVASFASADFSVSSGAVSIKSGGVSNTQLANSSVTIGSDAVALGSSRTDINGLTSLDVDNITVDGNTISTTNTNGNLILDPNGTGVINVSSARITSLGTPTQTTDAATKAYVDSQLQGLDVKNSVRVATTANGTLSSAFANGQTVDGVTLATGDRILLKNQSTGSQNGIYTVNASGAPTRATDFDEDSEVTGGTFFFVEEGTTNGDNGFVMTNDGTVTVGSTALVFTQFSGAGQVIAGAALTKSGNTLNVGVDDSSIEVNSDALRVKASGITNAMLAGSIDLTAKVTGALPVGNGGTGLSSIAKGSVLVANSANTLSALDGGGSNDGILTYTASSDTIAFATAVDGGTFS